MMPQRKPNPSQPFYSYSSYNRAGGRAHPIVTRRMNMIMDQWAALMTIEEIATDLDIATDTVRRYLERARRRGDPRATRPDGINKKTLKARTRRHQINILHGAGFGPAEIASRLGCHVRLVQIRLKENASA